MATLEQILGYRNLTGVIQLIKSGIPGILPDAFYGMTRQVPGNRAEYYRITGTRQTARLVQYGAPAQRRGLRDVDSVPVTLMHTHESQQWPMALMVALHEMGNVGKRDDKAKEQAEYQTREFKKLFSNLRIAASLSALFTGKVYFDASGNFTTTASAGGTTIDYHIPEANTGNLNGTLSVGWQNASAPIMTDLRKLQTSAIKTHGYPLTTAFYDDTVPGYIGRNTEAQSYLKLNPAMNQSYLTTGTVPAGFGGIKNWIPAGQAFFSNASNTVTSLFPTNGVVFTPDPEPDWWEIYEGSILIPTSVTPVIGAMSEELLRGSSAEVFGMFSYGMLSLNPFMVEQFAGDTFLPIIKVPGVVYQATVNF